MKFVQTIILFMLLCSVSAGFAQKTKLVKLKATVNNLSLKNYCVVKVIDDRKENANIGTMRAGLANKTAYVALPDGTKESILSFINENAKQDFRKDTITMHITNLKVSESTNSMKERATLNFTYTFYRNETKLTDYKGSNYVETGLDASPYIGRMVSQSIETALEAFDDFWKENKSHYTAQGEQKVSCKVNILKQNSNSKYIVFQPSTHLNITDFQSRPDVLNKAAAITYSGMLFSMKTLTDNNGITVTVDLTPFFDKTKSWMKLKTTYVLDHEEIHFKITALKTYELAMQIRQADWDAKSLNENLQSMFDKANAAMEALQNQYDTETKHGIDTVAQKRWSEKINKELEAQLSKID